MFIFKLQKQNTKLFVILENKSLGIATIVATDLFSFIKTIIILC